MSIGDLKLSILSGGVSADDLAIADDPAFSGGPFVRAKSLKVGVELWTPATSRSTMGAPPAHAGMGAPLASRSS